MTYTAEIFRLILIAMICVIITTLPMISYSYGLNWEWAQRFPLDTLNTAVQYITIFFHEIGHTLTAGAFGYISVPSFDLAKGGGMTYTLPEQYIFVPWVISAIFGYLLWIYRSYYVRLGLGVILIPFYLYAAYTPDLHNTIILFMGRGTEILIGAFFIYRVLYNIAPRGTAERFMNIFLGLSFMARSIVDSIALLNKEDYRSLYFEQKGKRGFGDFDRISETYPSIDFEGVVTFSIVFTIVMIAVPFIHYCHFMLLSIGKTFEHDKLEDLEVTDDSDDDNPENKSYEF